jgi:hypothetical protein
MDYTAKGQPQQAAVELEALKAIAASPDADTAITTSRLGVRDRVGSATAAQPRSTRTFLGSIARMLHHYFLIKTAEKIISRFLRNGSE